MAKLLEIEPREDTRRDRKSSTRDRKWRPNNRTKGSKRIDYKYYKYCQFNGLLNFMPNRTLFLMSAADRFFAFFNGMVAGNATDI